MDSLAKRGYGFQGESEDTLKETFVDLKIPGASARNRYFGNSDFLLSNLEYKLPTSFYFNISGST